MTLRNIVLENTTLAVHLSEENNQLFITDKRINKVWTQEPFPAQYRLTSWESDGKTARLQFEYGFSLIIALENECELLCTLSADQDFAMDTLAFPPAVLAPDEDHYILQTNSEGLLLPVNDCGYPLGQEPIFRCSGGPAMAWLGMVDHDLNTGFMEIYETPYDAQIRMQKTDNKINFQVVWLASKGKFAYERKVRLVFFHEGGYVAQCKRYRAYAWDEIGVISLRERMKRFPSLEKITGAVHIYVWNDARDKEFIQELKASGIEKAAVAWDPNHYPYPDQDFTPALKEAGYCAVGYQLFTDIHDSPHCRIPETGRTTHFLTQYHLPFEYITAKQKDGSTYYNQYGNYVCPDAVKPEIIDRLDEFLHEYPLEAIFLDVYQANGIYECHDSRHPLTRKGYAEKILENYTLIEDRYNVVIGSEFGADYGNNHAAFAHGMMTLQVTWFNSAVTKPGTIYYYGNWSCNESPSIMLSTHTVPPSYHRYSLNTYTRVPLYELVYHDAVVTSWRWEDGNHRSPEIWWKKDLFNVLYGTSPLWTLDKSNFEAHKITFAESYQHIMPFIQEVCLDEMISHRFLTCDHQVQETVFSSGKKVIVNFGDQEYRDENVSVPARDYAVFELRFTASIEKSSGQGVE